MWAPIAGLFLYVAIQSGGFHFYLLSFSVSLIWGLVLYKGAQTKILFPTIDVSDVHIVVNTPMSRRSVYNLDRVEGCRFYWHMLYFRHNGWPILVPLPSMPKSHRQDLLDAMRNQKQATQN